MDISAASMFVAAVHAGSLSAGAEALGVPLATLSRRIRQLEVEIGVELLARSTRGIRLTEAGGRLYEHAAKGVQAFNDGENAVRTGQAELRGKLRLTIPTNFDPWWSLLSGFQQRYPGIRLSVQVTERLVDLVHDGIDVALRVGPLNDDLLVSRHVVTFGHKLVASPILIRRLGLPLHPRDLTRFPCAIWSADTNAPAFWQFGVERVVLAPVLSTNDYDHLRKGCEAGEFITELPDFIAQDRVQKGQLQEIDVGAALPTMETHLLYLPHRHPSSIVRAYLDYCSAEAKNVISGQPASDN